MICFEVFAFTRLESIQYYSSAFVTNATANEYDSCTSLAYFLNRPRADENCTIEFELPRTQY